MPSPSANEYKLLAARATIILKAGRNTLTRREVQALYGAAFVSNVAAWNAYVVGLVGCFFQEVADPAAGNFHAMHTLANEASKLKLERFNTPNAENSRTLILTCTGYDPWPDWQWVARGMNALATRQRLNEILKVRHSFAHGYNLPGYVWTQSVTGETRLTLETLEWTRAFFNHLVKATDQGLKTHLHTGYTRIPAW